MTDERIERNLAQALDKTAPDDVEGVLSRCQERKGTNLMTTKKALTKKKWMTLVAACLALMILGAGVGMISAANNAVASVISLDVNPSIELKINSSEKVLSCAALNDEAETVLADMDGGADLKGAKLDVAVNAIVGSLVRNGYLDKISSAILISVEDKDQTRAAKLQQELTATVDSVLSTNETKASVLSQTVNEDAELEERAHANNVSTGKAALIERVIALNGELKFEALCTLTVEELKDLIETGASGMPVGREAAQQAAEAYAKTAVSGAVVTEVDAELDETPARYEVELQHATLGELEYWVDAYTGEVLKTKTDDDAAKNGTSGKTGTAKNNSAGKTTESKDSASSDQTNDIGEAAAKQAALSHAGVSESSARELEVEREKEGGRLCYEVEFKADGIEYEYTIDGETGVVLQHSAEMDD